MRPTFPEFNKKCGIYAICNMHNYKMYVGKSKNIGRRFTQYYYDFKYNRTTHVNTYLMSAFSKYGIDSFKFSILEECELSELSDKELLWIFKLNTIDRACGYNLRYDSSSLSGVSSETSNKISNRLKREWATGLRSGHSYKLKLHWLYRDRHAQASLFSKTLTKWEYIFEDGRVLSYRDLVDNGLTSILSCFHRNKSNSVMFKGILVERRSVRA